VFRGFGLLRVLPPGGAGTFQYIFSNGLLAAFEL
jgi:uncharacterized membrane protein